MRCMKKLFLYVHTAILLGLHHMWLILGPAPPEAGLVTSASSFSTGQNWQSTAQSATRGHIFRLGQAKILLSGRILPGLKIPPEA